MRRLGKVLALRALVRVPWARVPRALALVRVPRAPVSRALVLPVRVLVRARLRVRLRATQTPQTLQAPLQMPPWLA